jgi:hypothetical protein
MNGVSAVGRRMNSNVPTLNDVKLQNSHLNIIFIIEGKIEGKVPRGRPRDKCIGQIKKKVHRKKYQEVSQLALDRVGWRAAVNQS